VIDAGINFLFAVHQKKFRETKNIMLGCGITTGLYLVFETSVRSEYRSDIYGEGDMLLGAVHGVVKLFFRRYIWQGVAPKKAFSIFITGNIMNFFSTKGIKSVYDLLKPSGKTELQGMIAATVWFSKEEDNLGEIFDVVSKSNSVNFLITDATQLKLFQTMKPGTVFELSHGFLLGNLDSIDEPYLEDMDVLNLCSKVIVPLVC